MTKLYGHRFVGWERRAIEADLKRSQQARAGGLRTIQTNDGCESAALLSAAQAWMFPGMALGFAGLIISFLVSAPLLIGRIAVLVALIGIAAILLGTLRAGQGVIAKRRFQRSGGVQDAD